MQKLPFSQDWRFFLGDPPVGHHQEPDDRDWRLLDLPHDWSIEQKHNPDNPSGPHGGYFPMGRGWYTKRFFAPEEWREKIVLVEFEGIYMNAEVWLNGNYLGRHPYGYTSFTCDLTSYLTIGASNTLKVLVDNGAQVNSRWYSGSGIYRPVWLRVSDRLHVSHWGTYVTTPQVMPESALVHVQTTVENEGEAAREATLISRLLRSNGSLAGETETSLAMHAVSRQVVSQDITIPQPRLWSIDTPYLYRLETEITSGGGVIDREETLFGIRSLHFSPVKGFLLNGRPLKLKGGCVHHDNGVLGAASYPSSEERKVALLKASGYNAVRCAHNPPAPAFLEACDRLGMLVIDEAFDCWREGKNPYDYHVAFDDWWQRDMDSMLLRDRNHPSIILWSIGNELIERDGRSGGAEIAHRLAGRVHEVDPTRPVTAAMCGNWNAAGQNDWQVMDPVFAALDVGGYNYQWKQYRTDDQRVSGRIICGLESAPKEAFETWMLVEELERVIGDFVWTSLDYLGEAGIGRVHFEGEKTNFLGAYPWHQANCGDLDLCGFKRPQSFYRDILWGCGEKLYIAVHAPIPEGKTPTITYWGWPDVSSSWTWPGQEGKPIKVDVYSACTRVELFLNGRSLGIQPATKKEKYIASFQIAYEPGELKALGYKGKKEVAETILQTTSAPACLRMTPSKITLPKGPQELCFVIVEILDGQNRVHPNANQTVFFTVKGEGSLLAVGNGNPVSTESYVGNSRQAYRGRCLAIVKSSGEPGILRLRAQADGFEGAETLIHFA